MLKRFIAVLVVLFTLGLSVMSALAQNLHWDLSLSGTTIGGYWGKNVEIWTSTYLQVGGFRHVNGEPSLHIVINKSDTSITIEVGSLDRRIVVKGGKVLENTIELGGRRFRDNYEFVFEDASLARLVKLLRVKKEPVVVENILAILKNGGVVKIR